MKWSHKILHMETKIKNLIHQVDIVDSMGPIRALTSDWTVQPVTDPCGLSFDFWSKLCSNLCCFRNYC